MRVLVTRPASSSAQTADRLAARGYEPVILPLTRITPVQPENVPDIRGFSAVAVTSANAIRHAPQDLLQRIRGIPVCAVGERTGATARSAGLDVFDAGSGDAATLVETITATVSPGTGILLLCGRLRRDTVERALAEAGFHVTPFETYDTIALNPSDDEVAKALGDRRIDFVLIYSALAGEVFSRLARRKLLAPFFAGAQLIAISGRVAANLPDGGSVHIAREPTEESMFSLLAKTK